MTKFIHTIKDSEPVKQDNVVGIEWSLEIRDDGKLCLMGYNENVNCPLYMVTVELDGRTTIANGFLLLGLPQPALLGD